MTDPWTWTVDQVIYNLCFSDDLWVDRQNSKRPNAALLEQKLQEHAIDGATLIEHVDMKVLRGDLGIKAFGEASSILHAIEKLRNLSPRYVEQQAQTLFRQDSVSRTASEFCHPQSSFKSPFSSAFSTIAFSPKRLPSPTPTPVHEQPAASGHQTIEATTTSEAAEPLRKKRRVQLTTLPPGEHKDSFLGKKTILDDLFFTNSEHTPDQDSDDSGADDFTLTRDSQASSTGRNLFVGNRMKYYLRTSPRALSSGKAILQPYPVRLLTSHNPHAMLFSVNEGEARMTMCNPANPDQETKHDHDYSNEWSFLSKWDNKETKILPVYGDSDSENGYSGSLLSEFEQEEAEREGVRSNNQQLSPDEVSAIINAYVEEQERIWTRDKLPGCQGRAWSIWRRSRGRRRPEAIATIKHDIDRMINRHKVLKQGILDEVWTRSRIATLKELCRIMEVTIEEHMKLKFQLEVLQRAEAPERREIQTAPRVRDRPVGQHDMDEESLHSESSMNFIENDEARHSPRSSPDVKQTSPLPRADHDATVPPHSPTSALKPAAEDVVDLTGSSPIREPSSSSRRPSSSCKESSPPPRKPSTRTRRRSSSVRVPSSPPETSFVDWNAHPEDATQDQIRTWSYDVLEELSDRKRLILKIRQATDAETRQAVDLRFEQLDETKMHNEAKRAIAALKKDEQTIRGVSADASRIIFRIARLWICWQKCDHRYMTGAASREILSTAAEFENFEAFYDFCHSLVPLTAAQDARVAHPVKPSAPSVLPRKGVKTFSGGSVRDNGAQRLQESGQARLLAAEQAKSQMESSGIFETAEQVIVNLSKTDDQEYIFVNKHIASRIKPHQVEGIQFIWRELVNTNEMQGCLLAHTMGLGKTMQAITFLVTLAECSNSHDPAIIEQIPMKLRKSKTLLLCPPTLIENWKDEWKQWQPETGPVGLVRAATESATRLTTIKAWYEEGGVLIMGYEMFTLLIANKAKKVKGGEPMKRLSDEDHEFVVRCLLEGPNIVVADEAHKMKNMTSQVSQLAQRFRTTTRLALTGSPLANNLTEYYAMIDWIAPGYLGDFDHFKLSYKEPIEMGTYADATKYEQRRSVKKLKALMADIEPKVQRKDVHAISKDLKQKTEFVLNIPLTLLQYDAYQVFVQSLTEQLDSSVATAKLFDWLSVLGLLCDHPSLFKDKIEKRHEVKAAKARAEQNETEDGSPDISSMALPDTLFQKEKAIFDEVDNPTSLTHGIKMKLIKQILFKSQMVGDKVLIFSHLLPSLDYLQSLINEFKTPMRVARIEGKTPMAKRQQICKDMNTDKYDVCLISLRAGGVGLNIPGANRVILVDFSWNPQEINQAIGRSYRLGQQKEVFVYHLVTAGSFEEKLHQITIFKQQLAARVVDKKTPNRAAVKVRDMLLPPQDDIEHKDLTHALGLDEVLDSILAQKSMKKLITSITTTDTLHREADEALTAEEEAEVQLMIQDDKERKANPVAWASKNVMEQRKQLGAGHSTQQGPLQHPGVPSTISSGLPASGLGTMTSSAPPPPPPLPDGVMPTTLSTQILQPRPERVSTLPPPPPIQVNVGGNGKNEEAGPEDADMEDVEAQEQGGGGGTALGSFLTGGFGRVRNALGGTGA